MVPWRWRRLSWEKIAQEDPLYAIMSVPAMRNARVDDRKSIALFFKKGARVARDIVFPALSLARADGPVIEYGCGAGRVLNSLVTQGIDCFGIDVSPTMIEHARRLVPGVRAFHLVDERGRTDLPDQCARLVYSYAVVQHIDRLSRFDAAIAEMARLVKPGGILAVHAACRDLEAGQTWNFERFSIYPRQGRIYFPRLHTQWNGVCIGSARMMGLLVQHGLVPHAPTKYKDWSAIFTASRPALDQASSE